jgi:hypothetical protein
VLGLSNLALQQVLWLPLRLCSHSVLQQSTGFGGSVFEHPHGSLRTAGGSVLGLSNLAL